MDMDNIIGKMVHSMLEILLEDNAKDKENGEIRKEMNMKEILKMIKKWDWEYLSGQMVMCIRGSLRMI